MTKRYSVVYADPAWQYFNGGNGSIYSEPKTKHSQKPHYFRKMIADSFPVQNKIELFAREKYDGWDAWGNEIQSDIVLL